MQLLLLLQLLELCMLLDPQVLVLESFEELLLFYKFNLLLMLKSPSLLLDCLIKQLLGLQLLAELLLFVLDI